MEYVKLFYNPFSGDRRFKDALDACAEVFLQAGCLTHLVRATSHEALDAAVATADGNCRALVAAGGDGTVHYLVNAMKQHQKDIPVGIIPAGTANDFASHLKMPKNPREAAEAIVQGSVISADLGLVNGRYFINSCGAGLFINISHEMTADAKAKSVFGKLAYYVKGVGQLPNIKPLPLRITTRTQAWEDEFLLVLAANTGGSGGFENLAPGAEIDDGLMDFIAFRAMNAMDVAGTLLKVLSGGHINDPKVLLLRESAAAIESLGSEPIDADTDGERGAQMPLKISCEKDAWRIVVPPVFRRFHANQTSGKVWDSWC